MGIPIGKVTACNGDEGRMTHLMGCGGGGGVAEGNECPIIKESHQRREKTKVSMTLLLNSDLSRVSKANN